MNSLEAGNIYHPKMGMNIDSNGIGMGESEAVDMVNLQITSSLVKPRRGSILFGETTYTQPIEDIREYAQYNDPVSGNILMAFCTNTIWKYTAGAGWSEITGYDGLGGGLIEGKGVDTWSITKALDDTLGATLVAAGSIYSRPVGALSGGSDRVLIYYDRANNIFKDLELESLFPVSEEDTSIVGPGATTAVVGIPGVTVSGGKNYNSSFNSIVPGSFVLRTSVEGVIAVSGDVVYSLPVSKVSLGDATTGGNVDCYKLIPSDSSKVLYGNGSYVRVDGKEWSCYFITADYQNHPILADYDYYYDVSYKPVFVAFLHNALLMFSTYESTKYYPWRMRHSEQGDIRKTRTYFYQEVGVNDIGPITQVVVSETAYYNTISSYLYVYKQGSIQRGTYNSGYGLDAEGAVLTPFMSFEKAYSEGVEAYRTVLNVSGVQFFLGINDVYVFDGTERRSLTLDPNTGASRIREYIFQYIDLNSLKKAFAVYDEGLKNYMLFVPTTSAQGGSPVDCFIYNLELKTWTRHIYPETTAGINAFIQAAGTIRDLVGHIEDLIGHIEDLSGNVIQGLILAQTKKSYVLSQITVDKYEDSENMETFEKYLITRDFLGATLQHQDRWELMYIEAVNGDLTISFNTDYSLEPASFTGEQTLTFGSTIIRKQYNIDKTTNSIRFLIEFGANTKLRWLQPFYKPMQMTNT